MTSAELCGYFFQSLKLQKQQGFNAAALGKSTAVAILFAREEVTFDPVTYQIHLPGLGDANLEVDSESEGAPEFDWVATVRDQAEENWNIILGCGNPYVAAIDQGLPVVNGAVIAVPASLSPKLKN
jgi:hypothetical protein